MALFEQMPERRRYRGFKFHAFSGDGMVETQEICMQAEAVHRVVSVAIFGVAADGMSHIFGVDTYLILASGFQTILHE